MDASPLRPGYWPGLRELADRYGIVLVADEVITGFGRLGELFGSTRVGATPDIITTAKGLTSAYAPMGAVLVSGRIAAPLYDEGRTLLHGITFGGHPLCAAIALKNLEIFERDGVVENVRAREGTLQQLLDTLKELPIVGDVRGTGFFWAVELVKGESNERLDADERERLLRGFMPGRAARGGPHRPRRRPWRRGAPDRPAARRRRRGARGDRRRDARGADRRGPPARTPSRRPHAVRAHPIVIVFSKAWASRA